MTSAELTVGAQGRVVIPAQIRRELGIEPGDTIVAFVEDGRLVLQTRDQVERDLHAMFARVPRDVSLAEQLLAERREEARRETAE